MKLVDIKGLTPAEIVDLAVADIAATRAANGHDTRPEPPAEGTSAKPLRVFKLLSAADVRAMPAFRWRMHSVLPERGFAAIFGVSGTAKSFLALSFVAAIAEAAECFGHRTRQGRVVYVVLEGQAGMHQRIEAWEVHTGRAFPEDGVRFVYESFKLTDHDDVLGLAGSIDADGGADVVVLDTLNRAAPGSDENSSQDMGRVLEASKELQALVGGLVLLVHHAGKDQTRGLRGHSSIHAALDAAIEVTRSADDRREWTVYKAKDGRDGQAHPFRLHVISLGTDEDGEPMSSCVVTTDDLDPTPARVPAPTGGNQKIVLDALRPLFRESRDFGKASAPAARPCISLAAAVAAAKDRLPDDVDPKRRAERVRGAIRGMVAKGALFFDADWLWLP